MKISEIIYEEEYIYSEANEELEFENLTTDPKKASGQSLLIIPNSSKIKKRLTFDHKPVAIVCDGCEHLPNDVPKIIVPNPRAICAILFSRFEAIDYKKLKIIGITGTNGKTSTAYFIKEILRKCGRRVGFIGTGQIFIDEKRISEDNYSMTTPDPPTLYPTIKRMEKEGCEYIVMEVSSHALALDKVLPITFDSCIFTNLSDEHGDFHKSREHYYKSKLKLFNKCRRAIFNIDDSYARLAMSESNAEKNLSCGVLWRGDVYATDVENRYLDGVSYLYHGKNFIFRAHLSVPGCYNVYNSILAAAFCIEEGLKPCEVKKAMSEIKSIPGRFERVSKENRPLTAIIDYAHTEEAFRTFLIELKALSSARPLTVVFGCGGERDKQKRPRMAAIAESYADKIIVTNDNPRREDEDSIISDVCKGFKLQNHIVIKDREEAIKEAISKAQENAIVAVIGKGIEKYVIDKDGYRFFDERNIILKALEERGAN